MARWTLECPECKQDFTHSTIPDEHLPHGNVFAWLDVLFDKPNFPNHGLNLKCPNCKSTSIYQQRQLVYRAD